MFTPNNMNLLSYSTDLVLLFAKAVAITATDTGCNIYIHKYSYIEYIQWIPGENVRRPGPLLHPLIPPMSVVLATASADQELDSKAISENV